MISWFNKKWTSVALITVEEEYISSCSARCEELWLRNLLAGLFDVELEIDSVFCNNKIYVNLYEHSLFHEELKHIEIRYQGYVSNSSCDTRVCCDE